MSNSKFQGTGGTPSYVFALMPNRPGDNPQDLKRRFVPKIKHVRHGTKVAIYLPGTKKWQWTLNFMNITGAQSDSLREFFELASFLFFPDPTGSPSESYLVEVIEPDEEWPPELQGGPTYNVQFIIRQF